MKNCKVVNLEAYKKFRPYKKKFKVVKKLYNKFIESLKKIFVD